MEMTKGDANYFTEKTPIDILAKIKDDAKRQGRLEEREIAQKEVYAMQKKYDALSVEMNQNKLHYEKALSEWLHAKKIITMLLQGGKDE